MNPFALLNVFQRLRAQARQCPVCKHRQVVPEAMRGQAVRCDKCGATIPPAPRKT
jgi:uncharacterized paraquat-inducible protein A